MNRKNVISKYFSTATFFIWFKTEPFWTWKINNSHNSLLGSVEKECFYRPMVKTYLSFFFRSSLKIDVKTLIFTHVVIRTTTQYVLGPNCSELPQISESHTQWLDLKLTSLPLSLNCNYISDFWTSWWFKPIKAFFPRWFKNGILLYNTISICLTSHVRSTT